MGNVFAGATDAPAVYPPSTNRHCTPRGRSMTSVKRCHVPGFRLRLRYCVTPPPPPIGRQASHRRVAFGFHHQSNEACWLFPEKSAVPKRPPARCPPGPHDWTWNQCENTAAPGTELKLWYANVAWVSIPSTWADFVPEWKIVFDTVGALPLTIVQPARLFSKPPLVTTSDPGLGE